MASDNFVVEEIIQFLEGKVDLYETMLKNVTEHNPDAIPRVNYRLGRYRQALEHFRTRLT